MIVRLQTYQHSASVSCGHFLSFCGHSLAT